MKALNPKPVFFLLSLLVLTFASCAKDPASTVYIPSAADVTAKATLAELQQGRTLYVNNCDRCHSLPIPDNYSVSQWNSIMPGMCSRCGFTAAETLVITKYVTRGQ
jgi:cytochrome c5